MSSMCLTGVGNKAIGGGMADGYYTVSQASSTPPVPTNAIAWASTTVLNDVGVNDHTTYVEVTNAGGSTNWVFGMRYVSAGVLRAAYTCSIGYTDAGAFQALYWDGAAWQTWDTPSLATGLGTFFWQDLNRNPADLLTPSIAVCIGVRDATGAGSGPWIARIGDFRPST